MDQGNFYRIVIQGKADNALSGWSDDQKTSVENQGENGWTSTLEGYFQDQAALYGLLNNLYALGLPLISVQRMNARSDR